MDKTSRSAAVIGLVCGAELVIVAAVGGTGLAALFDVRLLWLALAAGAAVVWWATARRRTKPGPSADAIEPGPPIEVSPEWSEVR